MAEPLTTEELDAMQQRYDAAAPNWYSEVPTNDMRTWAAASRADMPRLLADVRRLRKMAFRALLRVKQHADRYKSVVDLEMVDFYAGYLESCSDAERADIEHYEFVRKKVADHDR